MGTEWGEGVIEDPISGSNSKAPVHHLQSSQLYTCTVQSVPDSEVSENGKGFPGWNCSISSHRPDLSRLHLDVTV
jgi:hypothetical protein